MSNTREFLLNLSLEDKARLNIERKRIEELKNTLEIPNAENVRTVLQNSTRDEIRVLVAKLFEAKNEGVTITFFNKKRHIDLILQREEKIPILCIPAHLPFRLETAIDLRTSMQKEGFKKAWLFYPNHIISDYWLEPVVQHVQFFPLDALVDLFTEQ